MLFLRYFNMTAEKLPYPAIASASPARSMLTPAGKAPSSRLGSPESRVRDSFAWRFG
jgi:hypothetical protein